MLDEPQDEAERDRIEPDERLVVEQNLGIHDDGARQRHAPRHAAGELRRHERRGAAQADCLQLGEHQPADQRLGQVGVLAHRERDVLEDVQVGEQRAVLEQHAHAPAQRVDSGTAESREILAEDQHPAAVGEGLRRDELQ